MRVLFLGWLAAMVATVAIASEELDRDSIRVAAYEGGKELCAINVSGEPFTIRCCSTATHDINIRRRYGARVAESRSDTTVWVTCVPIEEDVAQAND